MKERKMLEQQNFKIMMCVEREEKYQIKMLERIEVKIKEWNVREKYFGKSEMESL